MEPFFKDAAENGSVVNEIKYAYNTWGMATDSMQDHASTAGTGDPTVGYDYTKTYHTGSTENVKHIRLNYVEYPGPSTRRKVYYEYETDSEFAPLNRVADIADGTGDSRNKYAQYSYLGASSVVKVEYPEIADGSSNKLALAHWTSGSSYPGLDGLGRIIDHKWAIPSATPVVKDHFAYGYDGAGNRLYRENEIDSDFDELYHANGASGGYDGLNRLTDFRRGALDNDKDTIADAATAGRQQWTLDEVGNWAAFNSAGSSATFDHQQTRDHNKANEIADGDDADSDAIEQVTGTKWLNPAYDEAGNMTAGPKPGAETDPGEPAVVRIFGDTVL